MSELTLERRGALIALLKLLNEGLPEPTRREYSASGFVNEARSRTCPDCLANGRVTFGCETCHGSGEVAPKDIAAIALVDVLPDDGEARDPYATTDKVEPYGVRQTAKLGHVPARDAEIDRMVEQTREPFANIEEAIADANRHPYVWERERDALRRRYDVDPMISALDELRIHFEPGYHLIHSVYVYGLTEPSTTLEAVIDRALVFLHERLPDPLRAPGFEVKHPALDRRDRKAAA